MNGTILRLQAPLFGMAGMLMISGEAMSAEQSQGASNAGSFAGAFFYSQSTGPDGVAHMEWFGSILIWILLSLSIAGISLLINVALANGRKSIAPQERIQRIRSMLRADSWEEALASTEHGASDFDQMVHASLSEAPHGFQAMQNRAMQCASELAAERFRRVEPLNVLGQVAPMIGLFGTVYGMIVAFGSIVASGGNADPVALAGGIGTALVTTFWGLLVAIPALAGYATIRNRIDALNGEAEGQVLEMLKRFKPEKDGTTPKTEDGGTT